MLSRHQQEDVHSPNVSESQNRFGAVHTASVTVHVVILRFFWQKLMLIQGVLSNYYIARFSETASLMTGDKTAHPVLTFWL